MIRSKQLVLDLRRKVEFSALMISRRDLLHVVSVGVALTLVAGCGGSLPASGKPKIAEKILVIGAGMSGLAAARSLAAAGFHVIVLEARNRLGGRSFTDRQTMTMPVDLGASWIHDAEGNPITTLADQFGAAYKVTDYENKVYHDVNGAALGATDQAATDAIFDKLVAALAKLVDARQAEDLPDISISDAIAEVFKSGTLGTLSTAELQRIAFSLNTNVEHEMAADAGALSLYEHIEDLAGTTAAGAKDDVILVNGYDKIVKGLAEGLRIELGQVVKSIAWATDGVTVTTANGVFEADRVVVTLPIGVLKSGTVIFEPPLPTSKIEAMGRFGSGVLNKIYLRFPSSFWEDREVINYISQEKGHFCEMYNFQKYAGQPILLLFNAGAYAEELELMSDDAIVAEAMKTLRLMYGANIPDPVERKITRWGADPFARGSYSSLRPGGTGGDMDTLATPIGDRIFFAGEATYREASATVHGAYLSGIREADRIKKLVTA